MTKEDKIEIERKIKWRLDELQAMAEKYEIEDISINISSDSVYVRFYADDFEKMIGEMNKYNGEDVKKLYSNKWFTRWEG